MSGSRNLLKNIEIFSYSSIHASPRQTGSPHYTLGMNIGIGRSPYHQCYYIASIAIRIPWHMSGVLLEPFLTIAGAERFKEKKTNSRNYSTGPVGPA